MTMIDLSSNASLDYDAMDPGRISSDPHLDLTGGLGGGGIGGSNLNVTQLLHILQQLTPAQLDDLYNQLDIEEETELYTWLHNGNGQHMPSYEQQLMQYQEYRIHKILLLYVPPILMILGTFGNIFSFIILRRKAMLKFSTYFYLMILAVADTLVLYIGLLRLWVGELAGYDLRVQADWICKLTNVIGYTVSDFSVWLIIAVTTERFIVVCHPLKANTMCNTPRARKVILALLGGMLVLNMHFFWTVKVREFTYKGEKILRCASAENYDWLIDEVWPWVDVFIYSFLPFIAITVLNILIIRQVVLARRSRSRLAEMRSYEQRRPSHEGSTRLTVMLLTISFAFLLTTLPMNITSIAADFWNRYREDMSQVAKFTLARTVTELLMYVNHSMNFFLYCATGQKFRHQLVWMICYAKRTYNLSWGSQEGSQATTTRMESMRNGTIVARHHRTRTGTRTVKSETFATIKTDMYSPVSTNGVKEEEGYL